MKAERGQSLFDVIVCVAVVVVLLGSVLAATIGATHAFVPPPQKTALDRAVARELNVAVDILKYQGASIPATSVATTIPMPTGSPYPVQLSVATQSVGAGVTVTIIGRAQDGSFSSSAQATIAARAPYPGTVLTGGSGAAPITAPSP